MKKRTAGIWLMILWFIMVFWGINHDQQYTFPDTWDELLYTCLTLGIFLWGFYLIFLTPPAKDEEE